jgi:hypothetical protein
MYTKYGYVKEKRQTFNFRCGFSPHPIAVFDLILYQITGHGSWWWMRGCLLKFRNPIFIEFYPTGKRGIVHEVC